MYRNTCVTGVEMEKQAAQQIKQLQQELGGKELSQENYAALQQKKK